MKYAIVSDIHGNLEALTSVLADIDRRGVDSIHCLGDVIGYGSDPRACLDLVESRCDTRLLGNHEYTALGLESVEVFNEAAKAAALWTQQQLSERELAIMAEFEIERSLDEMYLVHASPYQPEEWHYIFTVEDARLAFDHLENRMGFVGHSHVPMILRNNPDGVPHAKAGHSFDPDPDNRYLVNVGSVGQPRDHDPRACYVIFDDGQPTVEFIRVEYDIQTAQSKMARAELPEPLIDRLSVGL